MMKKRPRVLMLVSNDLTSDQRVHRVCSTLQEAGYDVEVVGRALPDSKPLPSRTYSTRRLRLWFRRKVWFYLELNLALICFGLFKRVDTIHANDLDTLPAGWVLATLKRVPLVYDAHEIFTEVPELIGRPRVQRVWRWLERQLVPRVDLAFTVNTALVQWYAAAYPEVQFQALYNLPFRQIAEPQHNAPQTQRIVLYQGSVNLGRGVELMIDSVQHWPEHWVLWIIGEGDEYTACRSRAQTHNYELTRVVFWGKLPFEQLAPLTRQAWIGLSLEEDLGLNYRYATPNKVFDYIQAGVPVVVSQLPEMQRIVEEHAVGWVLGDRTPEGLFRCLEAIANDPELYSQKQVNAQRARETLCWENESVVLLNGYQAVLPV
jgi:glycosyltransferase involved in cell wall biosynthesis